jgi:succinyl-CoA synthetase beta subunit
LKMGLQGTLMQSVSKVVQQMYQLFVQKDLDLVEINPLAVSANGQVMALNGKVRVNERAIKRHPDIAQMAAKIISRHTSTEINGILGDWDGVQMHGKIGILGNGTGSVMTTLDLVANAGGKPGVCLNLRHAFLTDTQPTTLCDRLETSLKILAADKSIEVILINLLGSIPQADEVAQVIAKFVEHDNNEHKLKIVRSNGSKIPRDLNFPSLVVRLAGSELNAARSYLATLQTPKNALFVVENLDEAVEVAVRLAKATATKK